MSPAAWFAIDAASLLLLLAGTAWSVACPAKRIWPPPGPRSWQSRATWLLFYGVFGLNTLLIVLDWNSWRFPGGLRFVVGIPVALAGGLLVAWGVATLGTRNTSGRPDRFVTAGPYRFTRNPQYLGDMILFVGLGFIVNSAYLWAAHALLVLVFAAAPLAEEPWLDEQYGEVYREYCRRTPRFL